MSKRRKKNRRPKQRVESPPDPPSDAAVIRRAFNSGHLRFYTSYLVKQCGSIEAVESLTTERLPREQFDWSAVPEKDRLLVQSILDVIVPVCVDHLGEEIRTVVLRLLAIVAADPAQPLRRRTTPERLAAALVWVALTGNVDSRVSDPQRTGSLWWLFGVTSCVKLGRAIATEMEFRPEPFCGEPVGWDEDLGVYFSDVDLLTSERRSELLAYRQRAVETILKAEEDQRLSRPMVRNDDQVEMKLVESDFALAAKTSIDGGRQMVMLGLGSEATDPDYLFALSIPEARRLVRTMQRAVDSVATPAAANRSRSPG